MGKYFLLTSKIAARLRGKIFNGMSTDIYGEAGGRIGREDEFSEVRSALVHLARSIHYPPTVSLADKVSALKELYDTLMEHDADRFSREKRILLDGLVDKIMSISRQMLNDNFTANGVSKFARLARKGREYFESESYDPDQFISEELTVLAELIAANFAAYEETLNHRYVA